MRPSRQPLREQWWLPGESMQLRVAQIQMRPTRRSRLVLRGRQVQARMFQMRPNRQQRREARAKEPWAQVRRCRTHPSSQ